MEQQIIKSANLQFNFASKLTLKKKVLILAILLIAAGFIIAYYLYNKPHQSIANDEAAFKIPAISLVREFESNEKSANSKYLGKVVEVSGAIAEKTVDKNGMISITLQGEDLSGVGCEFEKGSTTNISSWKEGDKIKIKGICTGILMDVVLVDCVIEK